MIVGQGPSVFTVGVGRGYVDIFPSSIGVVGWCDGPG